MKYKVLIGLIFFLIVIFLDKAVVKASLPLMGKVIVIDVGHGGKDPGTSFGDILEKDINLNISLYLEEELSKKGASVILTREGDYDISSPNAIWRKKSDFDNRISIINDNTVNMYLSIHLNYLSQTQYSGGQIFYNEKNELNKKLAEAIQESFNTNLKSNREIKKIPEGLYMYKKLNPPGVLIECGFLSNANERKKLNTDEYQLEVAKVIADGVVMFY